MKKDEEYGDKVPTMDKHGKLIFEVEMNEEKE